MCLAKLQGSFPWVLSQPRLLAETTEARTEVQEEPRSLGLSELVRSQVPWEAALTVGPKENTRWETAEFHGLCKRRK